jgi:hypothetical protein
MQNIYSQQEIVGKVEFYKSNDTTDKFSMSTSDNQIQSLNSRTHKIELTQNGRINQTETDKDGFFTFFIHQKDSIKISVEKDSNILSEDFYYKTADLNDTLKLRISDKKVALYRDSIAEPEFYKKYNEEIAIADFKNGKRQILAGGGFFTEEVLEKREKLSKEYKFEYYYIFGCEGNLYQTRIAYRYNEVMKKLIGIKNVW